MGATARADTRFAGGLQWPIVAYVAVVHAGALVLCPFFFSWTAVKVAAWAYVATGLGITVGYHRLLSHASFTCAPWLQRTFAVLAVLAGEGPPLFWVMSHRKHHKYSDGPGDPHSPAESFSWSHWLWLFPRHRRAELGQEYARWVPKLARSRFYRALETHYLWIQLLFGAVLFAAGYARGGWRAAFSFLGYAFFLRMVLVLHATWLVNSLAHCRGAARYETGDRSRNNVLVGLVALGEGWHNNHHHVQIAANHGHRWWEFDPSFLAVLLMAAVGAVTDVKVYRVRTGRLETWFAGRA